MKKLSFALVSALTLLPVWSMAAPVGLNVEITCPAVQGENALTNFGDYVAGNGQEVIQGRENRIYFKSASVTSNLPVQLLSYRNSGVNYNSTTGEITCHYHSLIGNEPPLAVSYTLTNGKGGIVLKSTPESLTISLPVGLMS